MNVGWLQDFLTAAESGNFTRAAAARNSSQAAFSRRIMSLEAWLGVPLFDRSVFPLRLTPQGERFREKAAEIVQGFADAKTIATGDQSRGRDLVHIAMPHVLATGRLPDWILDWSQSANVRYTITTGSVHDIVTSLVSGAADFSIVFSNPQQPVHLSSDQYEGFLIGEEVLRPYASPNFIDVAPAPWPGTRRHPVPLLVYSPNVYMGRMAQQIIENAPETLHSHSVFESELGDSLRSMAIAGHGVAFLPDCCLQYIPEGALVPLGGDPWSIKMSVMAYRDRSGKRAAVQRLAAILGEKSKHPSYS